MKKIILGMFVVLATTISFSSCSDDTDTMTDDELATEIINYGSYSDEEETDLDELTITVSNATYTYDGSVQASGTWKVENKILTITNTSTSAEMAVGATMSLTISDEGKTLTAADGTILKKQ